LTSGSRDLGQLYAETSKDAEHDCRNEKLKCSQNIQSPVGAVEQKNEKSIDNG
jgi:hypothetical protein